MSRLLALAYFLMMVLVLVLDVVLGFELRTSPTWQLVVYHLMLAVFALGPFVLSVSPGCTLMGSKLRWGLVAAALFPVAAAVGSKGWTHDGLRSEGLIGLAAVFIGSWAILTVFACGVRGMMLLWAPLFRRCLTWAVRSPCRSGCPVRSGCSYPS